MNPSAFAEEDHMFKKYVLLKLLDLGFRVFGGAVRNHVWGSVHESERVRSLGSEYLFRRFDHFYHPQSWHNRKMDYNDIDCIGTYEQFASLTGPEMRKNGDLKYAIFEKALNYPIEGLTIAKDVLETFTVKISLKIPLNRRYSVDVDMFVCKSDKLHQLYKTLGANLDFACNGLCVQRVDGVMTTSFMCHSSYERLDKVMTHLKQDEALLLNRKVDRNMYHRVIKMMSSGWFVEFGITSHRGLTEPPTRLFVLARTKDVLRCHICNKRNNTNAGQVYARIDGDTFHFDCYVTMSVCCYEVMNCVLFNGERFVFNEAQYQELSTPEIVRDVDVVHELSATPLGDAADLQQVSIRELQDPDQRLDIAGQVHTPEPIRVNDVQVIGNAAFFGAIAADISPYEVELMRRRLGPEAPETPEDSIESHEKKLTELESANVLVLKFPLCRLPEMILLLCDFQKYLTSVFYQVLRS